MFPRDPLGERDSLNTHVFSVIQSSSGVYTTLMIKRDKEVLLGSTVGLFGRLLRRHPWSWMDHPSVLALDLSIATQNILDPRYLKEIDRHILEKIIMGDI